MNKRFDYNWTESDEELLLDETSLKDNSNDQNEQRDRIYRDILEMMRKSSATQTGPTQTVPTQTVPTQEDKENERNSDPFVYTRNVLDENGILNSRIDETDQVNRVTFNENEQTRSETRSETNPIVNPNNPSPDLDLNDNSNQKRINLIYEYFEKDKSEDVKMLKRLREFEKRLI